MQVFHEEYLMMEGIVVIGARKIFQGKKAKQERGRAFWYHVSKSQKPASRRRVATVV